MNHYPPSEPTAVAADIPLVPPPIPAPPVQAPPVQYPLPVQYVQPPRKNRNIGKIITIPLLFLACAFIPGVIFGFLAGVNGEDIKFLGIVCVADALILAMSMVLCIIFYRTLLPMFNLRGMIHPAVWLGLFLLLGLLVLNIAYHTLISNLFEGTDFMQELFEEMKAAGWSIWGMMFLIAVLPAFTEEVAFRGLVQTWLDKLLSPWPVLCIQAGIFAIIHMTFISLPILFLVGLLLGWVRYKSKSLWGPMLIHGLHNAVVLWLVIDNIDI